VRRWRGANEVLSIFNFNDRPMQLTQGVPKGVWRKRFDSTDKIWLGEGSAAPEVIDASRGCGIEMMAFSVLLYEKEIES